MQHGCLHCKALFKFWIRILHNSSNHSLTSIKTQEIKSGWNLSHCFPPPHTHTTEHYNRKSITAPTFSNNKVTPSLLLLKIISQRNWKEIHYHLSEKQKFPKLWQSIPKTLPPPYNYILTETFFIILFITIWKSSAVARPPQGP